MNRVFHNGISGLAGLGLGTYLFLSTHYKALELALSKGTLPLRMELRFFKYCFLAIVFCVLLNFLLLWLARRRNPEIPAQKHITRGFCFYLLLYLSILQVPFPESRLYFFFFFPMLTGFCSAYVLYHLGMEPGKTIRRPWFYLGMAVGMYILLFSALSLQRHKVFMTHAYDLGVFTQTLWGYSNGAHILNTVSFTPMYLLGDHWTPFAFLFVPFYWIWTDPRMLLIIQSAYLGMAAVPLYALVNRATGHQTLGMAFAMGYLMFPALHGINLADFHYISAAVPLFFLLFLADIQNNRKMLAAVVILLFMVREDIAFHVCVFGMYLMIFGRKRLRGVLLVCLSLLWFYLIMNVFLPYFNTETPRFHMDVYSHLGSNVPEMAATLVLHPVRVAGILAEDGMKRFDYLLHYSIPLGFGYLVSLKTLFLALPSFLFNILSNYRGQYTIALQYNSPVIPFAFFAAITGFRKMVSGIGNDNPDRGARFYGGIAVYLVISGLISAYYFSGTPFSKFGKLSEYQLTQHDKSIHEMFKKIPPNAPVCAQSDLVPHLSHREKIYIFPVQWEEAEYVMIDMYSTCFPLSAARYRVEVKNLFFSPRMGLLDHSDGVFLFKKDHSRELNERMYRAYRRLLFRQRLKNDRVNLPKGKYKIPALQPKKKMTG